MVIIDLISAGLVHLGALGRVSRPVCYSTVAFFWIIYNAFGTRKREGRERGMQGEGGEKNLFCKENLGTHTKTHFNQPTEFG